MTLKGPHNRGFNGFIWTHGFLETFEFSLLSFTEERAQGSELQTCLDFQFFWTHQLKSIARALIRKYQHTLGLRIPISFHELAFVRALGNTEIQSKNRENFTLCPYSRHHWTINHYVCSCILLPTYCMCKSLLKDYHIIWLQAWLKGMFFPWKFQSASCYKIMTLKCWILKEKNSNLNFNHESVTILRVLPLCILFTLAISTLFKERLKISTRFY